MTPWFFQQNDDSVQPAKLKSGVQRIPKREYIGLLIGGGLALTFILLAVFSARYGNNIMSMQAVYEASPKKERLIARMGMHLLHSFEMEKSAVMAPTEQNSMEYVKKSRAASAAVDQELAALHPLVEASPGGRKLTDELTICSTELGKINHVFLQLTVENTALKAAERFQEKGRRIIKRLEEALGNIRSSSTGSLQESEVAALTSRVMIASLNILNMCGSHIIDVNASEKDQFNARIKAEEGLVMQSLAALDGTIAADKHQMVTEAKTVFAEFIALTTQAVELSQQSNDSKPFELSPGGNERLQHNALSPSPRSKSGEEINLDRCFGLIFTPGEL